MVRRGWLALSMLVACERAPTSSEPPPPSPSPSPPTPIVPAPPPITPTPIYPVDRGDKLYDAIVLRISATELSANGVRLLPLTADTTRGEIERATYAALSPPQISRDAHVMVHAEKSTEHGRVVALLEAAKRAGYTRLAIGTSSP